MAYFLAGPFVALIGIAAVFFVLRRKSVEKRSMYSARRSQIEHKVRAARQRTLTPRGHAEKPAEPSAATGSPFDQHQAQPTVTYQTPAYEAPPVAPPATPPPPKPAEPYAPMPWDTPSAPAPPPAPAPAPAPSTFDLPPAPAEPYAPPAPEPFRPAPEPAPMRAPSEPAWTPAPRPAVPMEPVAPAASSTSAGAWSVVSTTKEGATEAPEPKKKGKDKGGAPTSAWQLASGDAPGAEAEELELKRSSGTLTAVALYAILVVGLVMVLIGVLVMVANSHVT